MTTRALIAGFLYSTLSLLAAALPAHADLAGIYNGIDEATGMRLEFSSSGDRITGVFADKDGSRTAFDADPLETGGETIIARGDQRLYMLFTEEALGVSVIVIPVLEDEALDTGATLAFAFLKDGVAAPPRPARYVGPPQTPGGTIDPQAFVESYAFWPSQNVGYGYGMVRGRYRTLIRLHAVVQTDMLWKMCRAPRAPAALGDALRGQGVSCADVLREFGRIVRPGGDISVYNRYRSDVEVQKAALVEAIRCSIDYRRGDPECKRAGARVAQAAVSMETVKTVLGRY